jgi:hypothetical protein
MRRALTTMVVAFVLLSALAAGASPAFAGSAWWGLTSGSWPSSLPPEGTGKVVVTAQDRGYASVETDGSINPVVLEDTLPPGLEVIKNPKTHLPEVEGLVWDLGDLGGLGRALACNSSSPQVAECQFEGTLPAGEQLEMRVAVKVSADASSAEANTVGVSGGGVAAAKLARPISVGEAPGFGIENYELLPEEEGGRPSTQAGVHPFQLTTVLTLNTNEAAVPVGEQEPAGVPKDLTFQLPAGFIGNPTPFAQCTDTQFNSTNAEETGTQCSPQTTIGTATITFNIGGGMRTGTVPLSNLVPLAGEPARFGFEIGGLRTDLDTSVRSGGDYGVTVHVENITELAGFMVSKVTFWGVPGDPRHDGSRSGACIDELPTCAKLAETDPPPLLSLPTACTGPMTTTVQADSWTEPHPADPTAPTLFKEYAIGGLDGCNHLQFNPEIRVAPDVLDASTPTGLEVEVHVPQTSVLNGEALAESALRNTTVALPAGVAINPGGADGLEACSEGQVGFRGFTELNPAFEAGVATGVFTPTLEQPFCPNASKIGTVEVETPLLPHALKGAVYLATQDANPFGSLIALYLVAEDPVSGTLLKIAGENAVCEKAGEAIGGRSCEGAGQLISTFENTPDLPFENLRLHFFGESRAPLGTPPSCGSYTTNATFAPWSGSAPSQTSSAFNITSGPNGSACQSPLPFAPSLTSGSTSIQAGGFSPFTTTISREDGNQRLEAISLHMPPGLSGVLTGVPLCAEAQADAGTCPAASLVGETTVSVGLGASPFTVTGGKVYITGPYGGAPFGLSIVVPTKAGPFTFKGNTGLGTQVVRAKIEVDPHTAQLTVTSDSSGPYAIPAMIEGIPLEIKHVNVTIDRPGGFTFNPTNCDPMAITGALTSIEGATQTLSVPFQATNCATLAFKPNLAASTSAKTSKAGGASLAVKLTYPKGPEGTQANIRSVKVDLPTRLSSRLSTLQKACTAAQFKANPAGCPAASLIGHAKAITPIIPVPLEGPAYFVSHGGEEFPSLIIVLQGYGVTVDLVGTTFISRAGITSSTFKTVPDVPVGTFELTLPEGKFSALAAYGNLCKSKLAMPTAFLAQNGDEIHESTPIAVTGCPKAHKAKTGHKNKHKKSKHKKA